MKQFEPKIKTIGGYTFYIRPFPAFTATNISGELINVVTPLLGALAPMIKDVGSDSQVASIMDINIDEAAPAITSAFSSLSGDRIESIMKKLLISYGNIAVDLPDERESQRLTQDIADEIFCGELQDMFILAFEVIRINFGSFFGKLGTRFGSVINQVPTKVTTNNMGA